MGKTDYTENKILNIVFKNTAWTPPATAYAALFTVTPTDSTSGTEVTGGSYARQALTMGTPSGGSVSNTLSFTFSGIPSGTVTTIGVFDALTSGNLLYYQALSSNVIVPASGNADIVFGVGDLTVTET